jgi:hypothetical protein
MRSNQLPPMEDLGLDRENNNEQLNPMINEEIEATLLERLEACELTWKIVDNGLLEDH